MPHRLLHRFVALALLAAAGAASAGPPDRQATFANPMDLPYRYQAPSPYKQVQKRMGEPYREAADPAIVRFKDRYWLFASHSKGYWHSKDLLHWSFVEASGYDLEKYAPTAVAMGDKMYLAVGDAAKKIWVSDDPMSGHWREAASVGGYEDPALFLDDDGKLYMYSGLAPSGPLHVHQLDPATLQPIAQADVAQARDKDARGWEVPGDRNEQVDAPSYVEGSWMTKFKDRYYLEYAAPGTQFRTYANGVLVADKPMGPFTYQGYSPFAFKPTGFVTGAGHGSTFQGPGGQWWHAGTVTVSQRHNFERRLALFPARFTASGELLADTYLADYPRYVSGDRALTGWMLLSRHKPATASSTLDRFPVQAAVDEDVQTWWSAKTGEPDEWFQVDLGAAKRIEAIQVNFADQDSSAIGISRDVYNYRIEVSSDGHAWRTVVDRSRQGRDAPHDYQVLSRPRTARFVRVRNIHSPDGAKFSLSDLRVFGLGGGRKPAAVGPVTAVRDAADGRKATINWTPAAGAEFYVARLGPRPDLLNQNYQVYDGETSLAVASLNVGVDYCFAVDAVNENGITPARQPTCEAPTH